MKLVIITAVESFRQDILQLLKESDIHTYSGTNMDGYNTNPTSTFSWFPGAKEGIDSHMFFAFTESEKIAKLKEIVSNFNAKLDSNNFCIKLATIPVDSYL